MSYLTPWLFLAAILILAVAFRFLAGDDPDNSIRHESGDGDQEADQLPELAPRDEDPGARLIAA